MLPSFENLVAASAPSRITIIELISTTVPNIKIKQLFFIKEDFDIHQFCFHKIIFRGKKLAFGNSNHLCDRFFSSHINILGIFILWYKCVSSLHNYMD